MGVDPEPEAAATYARELVVAGRYLAGDGGDGVLLGTGLASALDVRAGDRITLMATTPDGSLNAVDGVGGRAGRRPHQGAERPVPGRRASRWSGRLLQSPGTVSKLVVFSEARRRRESGAARGPEGAGRGRLPGRDPRTGGSSPSSTSQVKLLYIGIFGFVGAVLVVIVILSAAIVMTMAVAERTREIGTLRALGTRPARRPADVSRRKASCSRSSDAWPGRVFALVVRPS